MKKYIKPETTVVLLHTETIIAESSLTVNSSSSASYDGTDYDKALGREDNAWDIWGNEDASEE